MPTEIVPIVVAKAYCMLHLGKKCLVGMTEKDCRPGWPYCVFHKHVRKCTCADSAREEKSGN